MQSSVAKGKEVEGVKYSNYFDWQEPVARVPSHRLLAMLCGENEGFLKLRIRPPQEKALSFLHRRFVKGTGATSAQVVLAVEDSYQRLLWPSIETDIRQHAKERADDEALRVFTRNLRETLMAPPMGPRAVLAIDPGYRTGCKVVCLDTQGKLLANAVIYLSQSAARTKEASQQLLTFVSGLGPVLAKNVIAYRNENGPFRSRAELKKLPKARKEELVKDNMRIDEIIKQAGA